MNFKEVEFRLFQYLMHTVNDNTTRVCKPLQGERFSQSQIHNQHLEPSLLHCPHNQL